MKQELDVKNKSYAKSSKAQGKMVCNSFLSGQSRMKRFLHKDAPAGSETQPSATRTQKPSALKAAEGRGWGRFHALTSGCGQGQGQDLHLFITLALSRTQQLRVWACSFCQEQSQLEMRHKFNSRCVSVENR